MLDPFLYPAKELAVLYHERGPLEGVIQELYALLLTHIVIRTLMLRAAEQARIAPTQISFDLHHPDHG